MQKETKTPPKRAMLFCSAYQQVFGHFPTIPDHFGRLPKISEDYQRCPESTEVFQGEIRKIQYKLVKLKKFPEMFLDGCHAGLL